jgi:hypothetical protein
LSVVSLVVLLVEFHPRRRLNRVGYSSWNGQGAWRRSLE